MLHVTDDAVGAYSAKPRLSAEDATRLPAGFVRRMREVFGSRGDACLRDLPGLVASLARRWELSLGPRFPAAYTYTYVGTAINTVGLVWRSETTLFGFARQVPPAAPPRMPPAPAAPR
jgi:hypothetical protein